MHAKRFLILIAWLFAGAQPILAAAAAAGQPEVRSDRTVTFRLAWPKDGPVELIGRGGDKSHDFPRDGYELRRKANGVWEVTVGPLMPGLYIYRFRVAGAEIIDPVNPQLQNFFAGAWSKVEVPDPQPRPWQARTDVPHGTIEVRTFGAAGGVGWGRPVCVYLPPGYDARAPAALPVLYLLHGWDYDERAWIENGLMPAIMDNLIAAGRARPMIVVMPLGFSLVPPVETWPADELARWSRQMVEVLLPWVEATYRVPAGREHRAIAGFSMGGKQSLMLGLGRPGLFAWMGAFSSGKHSLENYPAVFAPSFEPGAPKPSLIWLGSGRGDIYFKEAKLVGQKLATHALPVAWYETEGRHTWKVWRECFSEFVQRVFQPASSATH